MSERTILIVDDDTGISDGLSTLLRDEGYSVASAANGQQALNYLTANKGTALILLDLMMPVMDGIEFRQKQLQQDAISEIPTVMMSASGVRQEDLNELGISTFLKKPIDINRLFALIEDLQLPPV